LFRKLQRKHHNQAQSFPLHEHRLNLYIVCLFGVSNRQQKYLLSNHRAALLLPVSEKHLFFAKLPLRSGNLRLQWINMQGKEPTSVLLAPP
jgi:hypothetical protein